MNIVNLDKLCEMFWDGNFMEIHKDDIPSIPSAFDGMTNGEVMKAIFESDNIQFDEIGSWIHIVINGMDYSFCPAEFWNAPYQKGGE